MVNLQIMTTMEIIIVMMGMLPLPLAPPVPSMIGFSVERLTSPSMLFVVVGVLDVEVENVLGTSVRNPGRLDSSVLCLSGRMLLGTPVESETGGNGVRVSWNVDLEEEGLREISDWAGMCGICVVCGGGTLVGVRNEGGG